MLKGALVKVDFHLTHWSIVRRQDGTSAAYSYTVGVFLRVEIWQSAFRLISIDYDARFMAFL
jgi:hypothetical protein